MQEGSTGVATLLCTQSRLATQPGRRVVLVILCGDLHPLVVVVLVCKEGLGQSTSPVL